MASPHYLWASPEGTVEIGVTRHRALTHIKRLKFVLCKLKPLFVLSYICNMIRIASILSNIVSIRVSDKVLFDRCSWLECEKEHLCPKCGRIGKYTKHDSYTRGMIYLSNDKRMETIVSIPRGICRCGKTHAFIPDVLIPFSSYSFRFVILILWKFLNRKDTVENFCSKYCIAVQTVYNWMNLFRMHYKEWTSAIKELSKSFNDMLEYIMKTPAFPYEFFKKSNHSFLQGNAHPHNCRMVFTSEKNYNNPIVIL